MGELRGPAALWVLSYNKVVKEGFIEKGTF